MLGDPPLDLAQRCALCGLGGELRAELRLVAGPAQEDHQVPGDGEGDVPVQVLLDQGERQVDAGGHAGRGGDVSVADVDGLRFHGDGRVVAGEPVAVGPVGRRPAPVEEPGGGEQDGARAHRDQARCARAVGAQPVDQPRVGGTGALAARDQQGVRVGGRGERLVRYEGQAGGGAHGAAVQGGGTDPVGARRVLLGAGEHLQRPGDVEALDAVEEDEEEGALGHVPILRRTGGGRNDMFPTFPAMAGDAAGRCGSRARHSAGGPPRAALIPGCRCHLPQLPRNLSGEGGTGS